MLAFTLLLLLVVAGAAAKKHLWWGTGRSPSADVCAWTSWRLPSEVAPSRYNMTFDVQMEAHIMYRVYQI